MGFGISDLADDLLSEVDRARRGISELWDSTLRIGITGLSGAGKTVFITSLVASLLHRERMLALRAEAEGRIETVVLRPQPDPHLPRFAYEYHHQALNAETPTWPVSTRSVSQLRLSIRFRPTGMLTSLTGSRTLNLDLVDYPGEWLLDLPLIDQSYEVWASNALAVAESPARRAHAKDWLAILSATDPAAPFDEPMAERLSAAYRNYLEACRRAGLSALAPGRFLMPGDLDGSPALTFAPLPKPANGSGGGLYAQMQSRFEAYKKVVVKPFFRDHFARLDRQVVLIDALTALAKGPRALGDLTATMAETLSVFRHGQSSWLDRLLGGRRIEKILFAASKADHLHHDQHTRLTNLVEGMLAEAARRASFKGASTRAIALAGIRATSEQTLKENGETIGLVRGRRAEDGKEIALYPGLLPDDVSNTLATAQTLNPGEAPANWPKEEFETPSFAPPRWKTNAPPHLRMDRALEFLIGDALE